MVVQHNIPAINSHRYLGVNNNAAAKNLEKLSSGFKINRAGDDAAGLAISEKMRGQIRGLAKAEDNTNQAINLIQTAEGGMQEMHSIVQRMRELAVQSTNGTFHNNVDREALDQEFHQLKEEFDRICDYTNYNNIKLLNGQPFGTTPAVMRVSDILAGAGDSVTRGGTLNGGATPLGDDVEIKIELKFDDITGIADDTHTDTKVTINGSTVTATVAATANGLVVTTSDGEEFTIAGNWTIASALQNDNIDKAEITFKVGDLDTLSVKAFDGGTPAGVQLSTNDSAGSGTTVNAGTIVGPGVGNGGDFTGKVIEITSSFDGSGDVVFTTNDSDYTVHRTGADTYEIRYQGGTTNVHTLTFTESQLNQLVAGTTTAGQVGAVVLEVTFDNTNGETAAVTVKEKYEYEATAAIPGAEIARPTAAPGGNAAANRPTSQNDRNVQEILFQVGANGTADQQVALRLYDMHAEWLGWGTDLTGCTNLPTTYTLFLDRDNEGRIDTTGSSITIDYRNATTYENLSVQDLNIADKDAANIAIEVLYTALNDVSTRRAELGAVQNRLEYTLNNLGVTKENLTAAESTIRDVDMAKEMMDFTKNSILIQSAQAMLAQANTLPQGVLQLLR